MKALRLKIAGWLDALEWWVSPYKKPGPKKRKVKQDALMEDLSATWKANGPDNTPSPLADAPAQRNKESEKKFGESLDTR